MMRAIKAELLKLFTVRGTLGILLGVIAINVAAYVAPGENVIGDLAKPLSEQQSVFLVGFLMRVLFLVFGIRMITEEWRYGTITPSLLTVPERGRLVAAKVVAGGIAGGAIAAIGLGSLLLTGTIVAGANDISFTLGPSDVPVLVGTVATGVLWSVIGLGFGTIVKNQLVATVTGLVWLMGAEDMLRGRLDDLASYLPGQTGIALMISPSGEALLRSIETLAAYVVITIVGGLLLFRRRDI